MSGPETENTKGRKARKEVRKMVGKRKEGKEGRGQGKDTLG